MSELHNTIVKVVAMGAGTMVPDELIPRCPHCGAEMFPWVRGYGNFLQGKKYEEEYEKISKYIQKNKDRKILLIELGVGRMTPVLRSLSTRRKLRKNMVKQQIQGYLFNKSTKYGERRCA